MGWIIVSILLLIAMIGGVWTATRYSKSDHLTPADQMIARKAGIIASLAAVGGFLLLTALSSIQLIGQRQVGIVKDFSGTITGSINPGKHLIAPWQSVSIENIGILREDFSLDQTNSAVSQDQQPIFAQLSLNYQVEPQDAVSLYQRVGPAWKAILLDSRVLQDFKEVTSLYTAQQITTKREQLRQDTKKRLTGELTQYGIHVVDFFVKNLEYTNTYADAITAKNIAVQAALGAKAKVKQAQAEAQQTIATAQGDARAIALKGKALHDHPEVLNLEAIDKLNPNAQVIICTGTGAGNCPSFLPQFQAPTPTPTTTTTKKG